MCLWPGVSESVYCLFEHVGVFCVCVCERERERERGGKKNMVICLGCVRVFTS